MGDRYGGLPDARNGRVFIANAFAGQRSRSCRENARSTRRRHCVRNSQADGIVGDLAAAHSNLSMRILLRVRGGVTLPFGWPGTSGHHRESLKKAEKYVEEAFDDLDMLHDGGDRHLLCGRRNMARAGSAAHVADRLSFPCHAQLPYLGSRGGGVFQARAPR